MKPQSLNKYSYCFNNPLTYNDPTGNWPNWGKVWGGVKKAAQAVVNVVKENVDVIQTSLDVAGMIPVVGEAFDAVNGAIYAARGDALNASLSFAACVPVVGSAATGVKLVTKTFDKVHDVVKAADKGIGWTGDIGENALKLLGGESQVSFPTGHGGRRVVDQLIDNVAHESKVGYASLTQSIQKQISKDVELVTKTKIKSSVWHFYTSPVTGKIGPSQPLAQALEQAGILWHLHY